MWPPNGELFSRPFNQKLQYTYQPRDPTIRGTVVVWGGYIWIQSPRYTGHLLVMGVPSASTESIVLVPLYWCLGSVLWGAGGGTEGARHPVLPSSPQHSRRPTGPRRYLKPASVACSPPLMKIKLIILQILFIRMCRYTANTCNAAQSGGQIRLGIRRDSVLSLVCMGQRRSLCKLHTCLHTTCQLTIPAISSTIKFDVCKPLINLYLWRCGVTGIDQAPCMLPRTGCLPK